MDVVKQMRVMIETETKTKTKTKTKTERRDDEDGVKHGAEESAIDRATWRREDGN